MHPVSMMLGILQRIQTGVFCAVNTAAEKKKRTKLIFSLHIQIMKKLGHVKNYTVRRKHRSSNKLLSFDKKYVMISVPYNYEVTGNSI